MCAGCAIAATTKHEPLLTKALDMSLMAKLAVKPLLIACLVLVAMLGA